LIPPPTEAPLKVVAYASILMTIFPLTIPEDTRMRQVTIKTKNNINKP
jgi:hypothetical protein